MSKKEAKVLEMGGLGAEMFKDCTPVQQRWLSSYCLHGDALRASEECMVNHLEAMVWMRDVDEFGEALDQARRVVGLMLEAEAIVKAKSEEGSDRLMIELLRAMMPERYDPDAKNARADEEDHDGGYGSINLYPSKDDADAV